MATLLAVVTPVLGVISLVCWVIILIDAFKNEVWKGIVGLLCGLYLLYYAFAEFEHEKKVLIICGWLLSGVITYALYGASIAAAIHSGAPTPIP